MEKACQGQLLADAAAARFPGSAPIPIGHEEATFTRKETGSERAGYLSESFTALDHAEDVNLTLLLPRSRQHDVRAHREAPGSRVLERDPFPAVCTGAIHFVSVVCPSFSSVTVFASRLRSRPPSSRRSSDKQVDGEEIEYDTSTRKQNAKATKAKQVLPPRRRRTTFRLARRLCELVPSAQRATSSCTHESIVSTADNERF